MDKVQPNEIVMLLLGAGVFVFAIRNQEGLKRLPSWEILMTTFFLLMMSWIATVLESFFWESFFNHLEHAGLAVSSVLTAIWSWKVFVVGKKAE